MARSPGTRRGAANAQSSQSSENGAFEAKLWAAADALRNNMDAAEYKHVVLGLIFLKYISDAFEGTHAELDVQRAQGADPEDPDEYRAQNIFWVPPEARWSYLKSMAPQPTIGQLIDDAMTAIERDNASLKGVLPKDYARPGLDKTRLGQIINLVSDIALGAPADRARDALGQVYEYFLSRFASAEGKSGGQFYTPSHVVRVLVEMLAPYKGRVYDPCCGSGGMFVQSEKFIHAHMNGNGNGGKSQARHLDLGPGVELHHLAARQDESRDPRYRRPDRPRRHFPQRPPAAFDRDSIDLGQRDVDSMHPNPAHADLCDLGMEIPLRCGK